MMDRHGLLSQGHGVIERARGGVQGGIASPAAAAQASSEKAFHHCRTPIAAEVPVRPSRRLSASQAVERRLRDVAVRGAPGA